MPTPLLSDFSGIAPALPKSEDAPVRKPLTGASSLLLMEDKVDPIKNRTVGITFEKEQKLPNLIKNLIFVFKFAPVAAVSKKFFLITTYYGQTGTDFHGILARQTSHFTKPTHF